MEVKGKKRKAGKLGANEKSYENGKPPVKKNKIQKEKKSIKLDDKLQNESAVSQSDKKMKKKSKPGMKEKKVKDVAKKMEVIEKDETEMETEVPLAKNRVERRQESGQYKPENVNFNEEQLKKRIEEISSRENLSKTARRKLLVFKKKLQILQGTYLKPPPPSPGLSENAKQNPKRKELQKKMLSTVRNEDDGEYDTEKAINAARTVKGLKVKSNEYSNDERLDKKRESAQDAKKKLENKKVKVEPEEDETEDEEEDEAEEESDEENKESDEENEESGEENEESEDNEENEDDNEDENEENEDDNDESDEAEEESDANNEEDDDEDENKVARKNQLKKRPELNKKNLPNSSDTINAEKKTRYVLFVGSLPYTATVDDIKKHFLTKVNDVTSVRIPLDQKTQKPRGIAFVEFNNSIDYEKGLSLHHSQISGRRINVMYSQGGSKTVGNRPNVVAKNKKLHALRKQGKLAGSVKESQKRSFRRNKQKNTNA